MLHLKPFAQSRKLGTLQMLKDPNYQGLCYLQIQRCLEALPNIFGEIVMHSVSQAALLYDDSEVSGAFTTSGSSNVAPDGASVPGRHLGLDASLCSNEYKENGTLQTRAIHFLSCIKI